MDPFDSLDKGSDEEKSWMNFDSMGPTFNSPEGAKNCFNVEFTERLCRRWWPFGRKSSTAFVPDFPTVDSSVKACYKISWRVRWQMRHVSKTVDKRFEKMTTAAHIASPSNQPLKCRL